MSASLHRSARASSGSTTPVFVEPAVATAAPAERAFWRARDIELQEADLEEYVSALARGAGIENGVGAA